MESLSLPLAWTLSIVSEIGEIGSAHRVNRLAWSRFLWSWFRGVRHHVSSFGSQQVFVIWSSNVVHGGRDVAIHMMRGGPYLHESFERLQK